MAVTFMLTTAVVQANPCSSGGECPSGDEPQNLVWLLQTKLQMNVPQEGEQVVRREVDSHGEEPLLDEINAHKLEQRAQVQLQTGHAHSMIRTSHVEANAIARKVEGNCNSAVLSDTETTSDFPVDAVYTWIKEPSKEQFDGILKACPHLQGGWQRFRNLRTFRFSFHLLEKHLPWVRKVFIVTPGEVPDWLNTSDPKVEMVNQQDIWPQGRLRADQPIHNSQSVEAHLHRIPGLSKHFIYLNDDMFVGRPLEKSFFFTDTGKPVIHSDPFHHEELWCQRTEPGSLDMNCNTHTYFSLTIPMIEDMQGRYPAAFDRISAAHCRGDLPADKGPTWLYGWYGIESGQIEVQSKAKMAWLRTKTSSRMAKKSMAWYREQLADPPDIGCINDDFAVNDESEYLNAANALASFMAKFIEAADKKLT